MAVREFTGFGGLSIVADAYGQEDHPCVLLLPGATQSRRVWQDAARALARAGRYVVCADLRGHGDSGRPADVNYTLDAYIADLVAVLAQLTSRPAIVGSTLGGWIALVALGEARAPLATGLVLTNPFVSVADGVDESLADAIRSETENTPGQADFDEAIFSSGFDFSDLEQRLQSAAKQLGVPTLIVRGAETAISTPQSAKALASLLPDAEIAEIEHGGHYVAFDNADEFNAALLEFLERQIPREAPEFVSGSDPRTLRDAMGCFATGITIITTTTESGTPVGLTANSFSSVSLDPPLVLACLGKKISSLPVFETADAFAVNILHIGQQPLSNTFASRTEDRFNETGWECWDHKAPIIDNSLASFECIRRDAIEQGDHIILVGEVVRARYEQRRDPLLYFCGKYRRLHFN